MRIDTVIVGAGQAGLAVSRLLADAGHEHVVVERGGVGQTWRSQRWDSFRLNTPNWMSRLPLDPGASGDPDAFAARDEVVAWLERYADGLPVETGVSVEAVGNASGSRYSVVTSSGLYAAENVVLASGGQNVGRVPELARRLPAGIQQLHVADYRRPDQLASGAILVVGGAQSGGQVAEELAEAGREVYLSTSRVGRIPRRYRGRDTMAWWREMGVWDERPDELDDASTRFDAQPLVSGTRGGHTLSLQQLSHAGVTINVGHGDEVAERWRRRIDRYVEDARIYAPPPDPDLADAPDPLLHRSGPAETDIDVGAIVWCTGFGGDFGYLRLPVLDADGHLVHQGGATASPGLFAIGLPWLRTRKSGILWGMREDAAAVADAILTATHGPRRTTHQ
jgi:putative flavoprotein involved in K+ transport